MKKIVVDTSFLINAMIVKEHKHKACVDFLKKNEADFIAPEMILIESASYFVRILHHNKEQVYSHLEKIQSFIKIESNYTKIENVIDLICKYKTRGADSLYIRLAHKHNCTLLTCDKDQAQKFSNSIYI
jgi:predicted nucleic acid-binding protein